MWHWRMTNYFEVWTMTFREFAAIFNEHIETNLKTRTILNYQKILHGILIPRFVDTELAEIQRADVIALHAEL